MSDIIGNLVGELVKANAPALGKIIGGAIGGPAGTVIGGLAGKALEATAEALGVDPEPETVASEIVKDRAAAAEKLQPVEAAIPEMIRTYEIEAQRAADGQKAEIERGFDSWQLWKIVTQMIVWGGWAIILPYALFGAVAALKPLAPMEAIFSTWGTLTVTWLAVYNGGHTAKAIFGDQMPSFNGTFAARRGGK